MIATYRLALLLFFITLAACGRQSEVRNIKLGHGLSVDHPVHRAMVWMGERLSEKSNGQMRLEIYPAEQLGSERQCLELLQIGSLDMTKVSAAVLENFTPQMEVFSLPYLFRDDSHLRNVLFGSIGKELLLQTEDYWLRGLTYFDAGKRSFYTKNKPIQQPSDLAGLKIRVQESPSAMNLVRNLGGSPTPISWGELYTALQQGVVDGAENNPPSFYLSRHYEVCKYYILDEHTAIPDVLVIGTNTWRRLSAQEQQWLQAAADEAALYQWELWAAAEQEAYDAVTAAGVEIIRPEKALFADKTNNMLQKNQVNDVIYDLIQRIAASE
ncbi:MAG TPA: TRAP transporter substrate-binding protein [Saprospiraceae bacterium]|nr:TRAP transporter substrate-binding protein [Saprospiraceae bacterium]HMP26280.1 TRAP transporter substrate-binding protein [Saprospiraceae bacterium]